MKQASIDSVYISSASNDARDLVQFVDESCAILQQLWRELGVARDEQEQERLALLRDVRGACDRKVQFYRDEHELASRRVKALRSKIAHIRWLFRDDAPHEFGRRDSTSLRDELASLEVTFRCLDQIRASRTERVVTLEAELAQLSLCVDGDRQSPNRDRGDNLSEAKIAEIQARVERYRPMAEDLARSTVASATRCAEILLTLEVSEYSTFDAMLLDYSEDSTVTRQIATEVKERKDELEVALAEARELYKSIEKREAIISERLKLDQSTNDSLRLTSRAGDGGRLLREERLRKAINNDLPKLTSRLEARITAWEQKHAMKFVWKDRAYLSYMRLVDREYEERMELIRAEKEKAREKKTRLFFFSRAPPARLASQDETKKPTRLRRRNSVVGESAPPAEVCPSKSTAPVAAVPTRRRRYSAHSDSVECVRDLKPTSM